MGRRIDCGRPLLFPINEFDGTPSRAWIIWSLSDQKSETRETAGPKPMCDLARSRLLTHHVGVAGIALLLMVSAPWWSPREGQ